MIDLGRYRAIVRVLGGVLAVLVVLDVALRLATGITPPALIRVGFHDPELRANASGRTSAVIERGEAGPGLGVILGSSSARAGLRPSVMTATDPARRWLNLAGTGSSFDELRYTFGPVFAAPLDADVAVLAIHPGWLAGRVVGDPALDNVLESPTAPRTSWLLFHRGRLGHVARSVFADLREHLLLDLGVAYPAVYPARAGDPFAEYRQVNGILDPAIHDVQLDLWRRKRWFDADWYAHADGEVADLAFVIAGCRRIARRVVIVLMPESSALRARMPDAAEATLRRALARLSSPPPVIDLRAALPDDEFYDHIHLGQRGADHLSAELAARLR